MAEKILLVDDDSNILDGYRRSLGREFLLETALGGAQALELATEQGPYAVVVSDMRMPGMDGIQLLRKIKALSPDTTRVMLTGNTEMDTAINAINEGSIFRFLTKPCGREAMATTLTAALEQYRLVTAEKTIVGANPQRQHPGTDGSAQPAQSCRLQPRRARPPLHPPHRHLDEAG